MNQMEFDKKIEASLRSIKERYMLVKDEAVITMLTAILSREPAGFPLESHICFVGHVITEKKVESDDSLTHDEATKFALEDPRVQSQMIACGFNVEGREILEGEVSSLLRDISKKIDAVLEHQRRQGQQLENIGAAVEDLRTAVGAGGGTPGARSSKHHAHVCVAVHPSPMLIGNDPCDFMGQRRSGVEFDRIYLQQRITGILGSDSLLKSKQFNVVVSATDDESIAHSLESDNLECFLYFADGIGFEAPDTAQRQEDILMSNRPLPKIVVLCLRHGAKLAAEQMSRVFTAGTVRSVVWLQVGRDVEVAEVFKSVVVPIVHRMVVNQASSLGVKEAVGVDARRKLGVAKGDFGVIHNESALTGPRCRTLVSGTPNVSLKPEIAVALNNIVVSTSNSLSTGWNHVNPSDVRVLACDLALVDEINSFLLQPNSFPLLAISPEEQSSANTSRHRGVSFAVVQKMIASNQFGGIFRISTLHEGALIPSCLDNNDFSCLFPTERRETPCRVDGDVLFWFDFRDEDISCNEG